MTDRTTSHRPDEPPVMPPPQLARYAGRCGGCRSWIVVDDPIVWVRGMGTRCRDCCVRIWGTQARVQFGLPAPREAPPPAREDPVDRPLEARNGTIDIRKKKAAPRVDAPQARPQRRPRTYEELFPDDD